MVRPPCAVTPVWLPAGPGRREHASVPLPNPAGSSPAEQAAVCRQATPADSELQQCRQLHEPSSADSGAELPHSARHAPRFLHCARDAMAIAASTLKRTNGTTQNCPMSRQSRIYTYRKPASLFYPANDFFRERKIVSRIAKSCLC